MLLSAAQSHQYEARHGGQYGRRGLRQTAMLHVRLIATGAKMGPTVACVWQFRRKVKSTVERNVAAFWWRLVQVRQRTAVSGQWTADKRPFAKTAAETLLWKDCCGNAAVEGLLRKGSCGATAAKRLLWKSSGGRTAARGLRRRGCATKRASSKE